MLSYTNHDWQTRLQEETVTKNDLNRLVMDYLLLEGYTSAAEEFSKEADIHSLSDTERELIDSRIHIKEAIQRGDVKTAIERVNDLNPEILDTNPELYFHLHQQRLIELIRQGDVTEALQFAQDELAPRGQENPQFLAELELTMALLAFDSTAAPTAPTSAPQEVADLLLPAQRQRTANELNTAILESLSQNIEPKLVGLIRLLVWGEKMLSERANFPKVDLRSGIWGHDGFGGAPGNEAGPGHATNHVAVADGIDMTE